MNNMQVHLIDVDSKIPNLALMKISAYHKARGDIVTFSQDTNVKFVLGQEPQKIYASIIFKKNRHALDGLDFAFPGIEIDIGGSGVDLKKALPPEIENVLPDYSIYPNCDYSIGFSTRGCVRNTKTCPFCVVPIKEGMFRRISHPREWHNPAFKNIVFLDNNILADKEWFMDVTAWCIESNLGVWFTQGLDIRKMDEDIARRLLEVKRYRSVFFAWDHIEDEVVVKSKIALLRDVGFTDSMLHNVQFYVYVDSDAEYDSGVYRCHELKKLGCSAFVMYNIDNKPTQRIINLRRWANRKWFYWAFDIAEFKNSGDHAAAEPECDIDEWL